MLAPKWAANRMFEWEGNSDSGIAGLVFLMASTTGIGVIVSMVALVVAIIAGATGVHFSGDEGSDNTSGFWPKDPRNQ